MLKIGDTTQHSIVQEKCVGTEGNGHGKEKACESSAHSYGKRSHR